MKVIGRVTMKAYGQVTAMSIQTTSAEVEEDSERVMPFLEELTKRTIVHAIFH